MRILLVALLLMPAWLLAADSVKMNDISLYQFGDFTKTWQLVTVRFRKDSGEMRFTYANPKAWDALKKRKLPYPKGAAFAKVSFKTNGDPAFDSSAVPSGARRFQFMVRDMQMYASTDGWGYALFQSDGQLFEGEPAQQTVACHACHKLVPERDYVFSEAIEVSPFATAASHSTTSKGPKFEDYELKSAPDRLKKVGDQISATRLRIVSGPMRRYFFGGTLDEITPVLIHELQKNPTHPTAFVSEDGATFKVVSFAKTKNCPTGESDLTVFEMRTGFTEVSRREMCYPNKPK